MSLDVLGQRISPINIEISCLVMGIVSFCCWSEDFVIEEPKLESHVQLVLFLMIESNDNQTVIKLL